MSLPNIQVARLGGLLLVLTQTAQAQPHTADLLPSSSGVTGLLNVPTTATLPAGTVSIGRANYADPAVATRFSDVTRDHLGLGLFDQIEISGQFSRGNNPSTGRWALRDLSFGGKLRVPGIPDWLPQLALGIDDYGGAVPFFRSRYAVSTYSMGPLALSAGYGAGPDRLDGPFGGARLALPWGVQIDVEYDSENPQAGVRWLSPSWRNLLRVHGGVLYTDRKDYRELSTAFGLIVHLPGGSASPAYVPPTVAQPLPAKDPAPQPGTTVVSLETPVSAPADPRPAKPPPDRLVEIAVRLQRVGFRSVQVRQTKAGAVEADVENVLFRVNELDGLGVALGILASEAGCSATDLGLVLRRDGLPLVHLRTQAADWLNYLNAESCEGSSRSHSTPPIRIALYQELPRTEWVERRSTGGGRVWDLALFPRLAYRIGTEVGAFDYSLALDAGLRAPLWQGAGANIVVATPPLESDNYKGNRVFDPYGERAGLQSAMLQQTWFPGGQLAATLGAGLLAPHLTGGALDTRWVPGVGTHTYALRGAYAEDDRSNSRRQSLLGSYELSLPEHDTGLKASYGRYLYGDVGAELELYRDFRDVRFSIFAIKTEQEFLGFRLRIPLSSRKADAVGPVVVRGTDGWNNQIRTTINADTPGNPIFPNLGRELRQDYGLDRLYANNGRWSEAYIRANLARLREAYWQYGQAKPRP